MYILRCVTVESAWDGCRVMWMYSVCILTGNAGLYPTMTCITVRSVYCIQAVLMVVYCEDGWLHVWGRGERRGIGGVMGDGWCEGEQRRGGGHVRSEGERQVRNVRKENRLSEGFLHQ